MGSLNTVDTVRAIADEHAPTFDLEVFDVEFSGGLLRVTADRLDKPDPKAGAALSMLQKLSKKIAYEIEERDLIAGAFTLEVSSPGLERKLRTADHFRRSLGETVKIKTFPGVDGDRRVEGRLSAATETAITVTSPEGEERTLDISDIAKATTVFDWGPQDKPGGGSSKNSKNKSAKSNHEGNDPEESPGSPQQETKEKRAAS